MTAEEQQANADVLAATETARANAAEAARASAEAAARLAELARRTK